MTLHYITTTPSVQARLLSEVNAAMAGGRVSRPVIKDSEARALPYLQACIKEGLRMYPPVTGLLAKETPKEGAYIDGKFAPPGTWIAWNSWGMQRDQAIYGVDAEVFRPERWLPRDDSEAEQSRLERMTETVGLVFGYGRFGCLGKGVATMELNKGIIEVRFRYSSFVRMMLKILADAATLQSPAHQYWQTLCRALRRLLSTYRHVLPHHETRG